MKRIETYKILKLELKDIIDVLEDCTGKTAAGNASTNPQKITLNQEQFKKLLLKKVKGKRPENEAVTELAVSLGIYIPYNAILRHIFLLREGKDAKKDFVRGKDYFFYDMLYVNINSASGKKGDKEKQEKYLDRLLSGLSLDYGEDKPKEYELFERSASQQRQNVLVMLNREICNLSHDGFDLKSLIRCGLPEKPKVITSKYAAYRALMMTSGEEIKPNNQYLSSKKVIVVPDYTYSQWKAMMTENGISLGERADKAAVNVATVRHKKSGDNCESVLGCVRETDNSALDKALLFDGEGIISEELGKYIAEEIGEENARSFQIRMPFVKGVVHTVDIHSFFKEIFGDDIKGLKIKDMYNDEYDLSNIHMILTKSMFKEHYLYGEAVKDSKDTKEIEKGGTPKKAFKYYWNIMEKQNHRLFISGCDRMFSNDALTIANYQFLSTLDNNKAKDMSILSPSVCAVRSMTQSADSRALGYFMRSGTDIECIESANETGESLTDAVMERISETQEDDDRVKGLPELLQYNNDLAYSSAVKDMIGTNKIKEQMAIGHIILPGGMRYLSGDLMQFLCLFTNDVIKENMNSKNKELYVKRKERLKCFTEAASFMQTDTARGDEMASCYYAAGEPCFSDNAFGDAIINRNPHLTRNEHVRAVSLAGEAKRADLSGKISANALSGKEVKALYDKYFKELTGVLMLPMNEQLPSQRLGGADYDGDIVRMFYDRNYIKAAVDEQPLPALVIPSLTADSKEYTETERQELVRRSNGSRVGSFSNLAFETGLLAYNNRDTSAFFAEKINKYLDNIKTHIIEKYTMLKGDNSIDTNNIRLLDMMRVIFLCSVTKNYQNDEELKACFGCDTKEKISFLISRTAEEAEKIEDPGEMAGSAFTELIDTLYSLQKQNETNTYFTKKKLICLFLKVMCCDDEDFKQIAEEAENDLIKLSCMVGLEIDSAKTGTKPKNNYDLQVGIVKSMDNGSKLKLKSFLNFKDTIKRKINPESKPAFGNLEKKFGSYSLVEYLPYIFAPSRLDISDDIDSEKAVMLHNTLWKTKTAARKDADETDEEPEKKLVTSYESRKDRYTAVNHDDVRIKDICEWEKNGSGRGRSSHLALDVFIVLSALGTVNNKTNLPAAKTDINHHFLNLKKILIQRYGTPGGNKIAEKLKNATCEFYDENKILNMLFELLPWNHLANSELRRTRFNMLCKEHGIPFKTFNKDTFDNLCCKLEKNKKEYLAELLLRLKPFDNADEFERQLKALKNDRLKEAAEALRKLINSSDADSQLEKINGILTKLHVNGASCSEAADKLAYIPKIDFVTEPDEEKRKNFIDDIIFKIDDGKYLETLKKEIIDIEKLFAKPENWQILPAFLMYARSSALTNRRANNRQAFAERAGIYAKSLKNTAEPTGFGSEFVTAMDERRTENDENSLKAAYMMQKALAEADKLDENCIQQKEDGFFILKGIGDNSEDVTVSKFALYLYYIGYHALMHGNFDSETIIDVAATLLGKTFADISFGSKDREARLNALWELLRLSEDLYAASDKAAELLEKILLRHFCSVLPYVLPKNDRRFRRDKNFAPVLSAGFIDGSQAVMIQANTGKEKLTAETKKTLDKISELKFSVSVRPAVSFSGESDEEVIRKCVTVTIPKKAAGMLTVEPCGNDENNLLPLYSVGFDIKYCSLTLLTGCISVLRLPRDENNPGKAAAGYDTLCSPDELALELSVNAELQKTADGHAKKKVYIYSEKELLSGNNITTAASFSDKKRTKIKSLTCSKPLDEFIWGYCKFYRYEKNRKEETVLC